MKRIHKYLTLFMVLLLTISMTAACTPASGEESPGTGNVEEPAAQEPAEDSAKMRVGLLMDGPINDQGWNATAFAGLERIREDLGAEIAYSESVSVSDMEETFRSYASQGFDLVIGHGFTFADAAVATAKDYPDTIFVLSSCTFNQEPNIGSVTDDGRMKGFLGGVVAGAITDTNKVGFIGGLKIPPIMIGGDGFIAGAKYVNPSVEVIRINTGDASDAGAAKELAVSMIDQGVDVLMIQADMAGLGAIEAAQEAGIRVIGVNTDQHELAPDNVVTSIVADYPLAFSIMAKSVADGEWKAGSSVMGLKENVVYYAPYYNFEDKITDQQKAVIDQVSQDIIGEEISIMDLVVELVPDRMPE